MNPTFEHVRFAVSNIWRRRPWWFADAMACLVIVALGYVYLAPASYDLFHPNETRMIGDNTDLISLSWQYRIIVHSLLHEPSRLLYGAVYTENTNAPAGMPLWIPWIERILAPLLTPITNDASIPTAMAWALMTLNGIAVYVFGRLVRWPRLVSMAAGICFAYNNYTRARANVHTALVGAFGIALIFIALELLSNRELMSVARRRRNMIWAGAALLGACLSAHYYLIVFIVLSPFFFLYFWLRVRSSRLPFLRSLGRMIVCAAPAVIFLAWNFAMPVAPKYRSDIGRPEVRPENASYLHGFGARPVDYLVFDIKLGTKDWLPARAKISEAVFNNPGSSNNHERSNGIRWGLLGTLAAATLVQLWPRRRGGAEERSFQLRGLFLLLAIGCFLCSMSPQGLKSYEDELGPSLLIFNYIPNFRVPSRFGIFAHFAVIVVAIELVVSTMRRWNLMKPRASRIIGLALSAAAVIDYAPLNPVLLADFSPVRKDLPLPSGECGMGMGLPYTKWAYGLYQETRGTSCRIVLPADTTSDSVLQRFSDPRAFVLPAKQRELVSFARCSGMDWLLFGSDVDPSARRAICGQLGWSFVKDDTCRAATIAPQKKTALQCLR